MENGLGGSKPKLSTGASPLVDITNVSTNNLKKKCERDRYALLTDDQKKNIVRTNRENRWRRKEDSISNKKIAEPSAPGNQSTLFVITPTRLPFTHNADVSFITPTMSTMPNPTEVMQLEDPTSFAPTLGTNEDDANLSAHELRRKHDRDRYASLSAEQKEARVKKARENRVRKKEESQRLHQYTATNITSDGDIQDRNTPQSLPFDDTGTENCEPIITPRRLPFTEINNVSHNEYMVNNDVPLSCVFQGSAQNTPGTDFLHEKSGPTMFSSSSNAILIRGYQNTNSPSHEHVTCNSSNPTVDNIKARKHSDDGTHGASITIDHTGMHASNNPSQDNLSSKCDLARANNVALTPQQKQAKLDSQRSRRQSMSKEQRQVINTRRRVARQSLPDVQIHDMNARQRSRRQNVTPGQRSALLSQCNASYAARRENPCAESIAMECPDDSNTSLPCSQTIGYVASTPSLQPMSGVEHPLQSCVVDNDTLEAILEGDSDDEYYMFAGQADDDGDEIEEDVDESTPASNNDSANTGTATISKKSHVLAS